MPSDPETPPKESTGEEIHVELELPVAGEGETKGEEAKRTPVSGTPPRHDGSAHKPSKSNDSVTVDAAAFSLGARRPSSLCDSTDDDSCGSDLISGSFSSSASAGEYSTEQDEDGYVSLARTAPFTSAPRSEGVVTRRRATRRAKRESLAIENLALADDLSQVSHAGQPMRPKQRRRGRKGSQGSTASNNTNTATATNTNTNTNPLTSKKGKAGRKMGGKGSDLDPKGKGALSSTSSVSTGVVRGGAAQVAGRRVRRPPSRRRSASAGGNKGPTSTRLGKRPIKKHGKYGQQDGSDNDDDDDDNNNDSKNKGKGRLYHTGSSHRSGKEDFGDVMSSSSGPEFDSLPATKHALGGYDAYDLRLNLILACGAAAIVNIGLMLSQFLPLLLVQENSRELAEQAGSGSTTAGSSGSGSGSGSVSPADEFDPNTATSASSIEGFGVPPLLAYFILTWDHILSLLISPWIGDASDRFWHERLGGRRRPFVIVALPLACLFNVLVAVAGSVYELCAYSVAFSALMSVVRPVYSAYLGDLFSPEVRSRANGVNLFATGVGAGCALLSMGPLLESKGLLTVMLVMSVSTLFLMAIPMLLIREPRTSLQSLHIDTSPSAPAVGRTVSAPARTSSGATTPATATTTSSTTTATARNAASAASSSSSASSSATIASTTSLPVSSAQTTTQTTTQTTPTAQTSTPSSSGSSARETDDQQPGVLRNFRLLWQGSARSCCLVLLALLLVTAAGASVTVGLSNFAVSELGISPGYTLYFAALFAGSYTLAAIPAGRVGSRIGSGGTRASRFQLVNLALLAIVAIAPTAYFTVHARWSLAVAMVLLGALGACVSANMQPLVYDEGEGSVEIGALTGMYYFVLSAGSISGKLLTGFIGEVFGNFRVIFLAAGLLVGVACACMHVAHRFGGEDDSAQDSSNSNNSNNSNNNMHQHPHRHQAILTTIEIRSGENEGTVSA